MVQPLAPLEIPDPNAGRRRLIVVAMVVVTLVVGLVAWSFRGTSPEAVVDTTSTSQVEEETTTTTVAEATITDTACTVSEFEISLGDIGESVRCAQIALVAAGYSNVEITGVFDEETDEATREFQTDLELYVDGIISKVTATELGVWPGLEAFIVRTPAPAPGAVDLLGMPLSPVASAGSDAPELPEDAEVFSIHRREEAIPVHAVGRYRQAAEAQQAQVEGRAGDLLQQAGRRSGVSGAVLRRP